MVRKKYNFIVIAVCGTSTNPCNGQGICIAPGLCQCKPGYFGALCNQCTSYLHDMYSFFHLFFSSLVECWPACSNGAMCTAPNTCQCITGGNPASTFSGQRCNTRLFFESLCLKTSHELCNIIIEYY